jgi:hypothetical protein
LIKVSGLDKLQRQLADAEAAMKALDGDLVSISFDPHTPASIEAAIQKIIMTIDERVGRYASNPFVAPLMVGLKETYRGAVIEKAQAARLGGKDGD